MGTSHLIYGMPSILIMLVLWWLMRTSSAKSFVIGIVQQGMVCSRVHSRRYRDEQNEGKLVHDYGQGQRRRVHDFSKGDERYPCHARVVVVIKFFSLWSLSVSFLRFFVFVFGIASGVGNYQHFLIFVCTLVSSLRLCMPVIPFTTLKRGLSSTCNICRQRGSIVFFSKFILLPCCEFTGGGSPSTRLIFNLGTRSGPDVEYQPQ